MSEELMENGVPQCEDQIAGSGEQGEEKPVLSQSNQDASTAKDEANESDQNRLTDLSELAPKDGEFDGTKVRNAQPFTVRMKVTQGAVVVTIKRIENDSTQTFFIPVRW